VEETKFEFETSEFGVDEWAVLISKNDPQKYPLNMRLDGSYSRIELEEKRKIRSNFYCANKFKIEEMGWVYNISRRDGNSYKILAEKSEWNIEFGIGREEQINLDLKGMQAVP
jgi:hypothetical protein